VPGALREWLDVASISHWPIFQPIDRSTNIKPQRLTDQSVELIVKRCMTHARWVSP
jgi:hypothetical protein